MICYHTYALISIIIDSLDWSNTAIEGPTIWDNLQTGCSDDNMKPAIISNKIQFDTFKDKSFPNQYLWLGLRQTEEGETGFEVKHNLCCINSQHVILRFY